MWSENDGIGWMRVWKDSRYTETKPSWEEDGEHCVCR